jgi:hypothetical protein
MKGKASGSNLNPQELDSRGGKPDMENEASVQPVDGEIIPISAKKMLQIVAVALLILPIAITAVWLWWTDTPIPVINRQVTWYGALLGLLGTIIGIVTPPAMIWVLLSRKEKLILGEKFSRSS